LLDTTGTPPLVPCRLMHPPLLLLLPDDLRLCHDRRYNNWLNIFLNDSILFLVTLIDGKRDRYVVVRDLVLDLPSDGLLLGLDLHHLDAGVLLVHFRTRVVRTGVLGGVNVCYCLLSNVSIMRRSAVLINN